VDIAVITPLYLYSTQYINYMFRPLLKFFNVSATIVVPRINITDLLGPITWQGRREVKKVKSQRSLGGVFGTATFRVDGTLPLT
jgi:hypothetical protein